MSTKVTETDVSKNANLELQNSGLSTSISQSSKQTEVSGNTNVMYIVYIECDMF